MREESATQFESDECGLRCHKVCVKSSGAGSLGVDLIASKRFLFKGSVIVTCVPDTVTEVGRGAEGHEAIRCMSMKGDQSGNGAG